MKFGMPSLIEFRTVEEHARFCAQHNLDFYELNLAFPWFQSDKIDPDELLRIKERYGIDYTVHFHDEINPFDFCLRCAPDAGTMCHMSLTLHGI